MTIRPTPFARWGVSALLLAIGGLVLSIGLKGLFTPAASPNEWVADGFVTLFSLVVIAWGLLNWSIYIQVDEATVTLGTAVTRRRCARNEIVGIRASRSPATRLTFFMRSDGTSAFVTSGYIWGEAALRSLADYLGVPLTW
jgi:hypothetical protein